MQSLSPSLWPTAQTAAKTTQEPPVLRREDELANSWVWQRGSERPRGGHSSEGPERKITKAINQITWLLLLPKDQGQCISTQNTTAGAARCRVTLLIAGLPGSEQEERMCLPGYSPPFVYLKLTQLMLHSVDMERSHSKFSCGQTFTLTF